MTGDWGFVVWIVVLAVPVGIVLISAWARARPPGAARLDRINPEKSETSE